MLSRRMAGGGQQQQFEPRKDGPPRKVRKRAMWFEFPSEAFGNDQGITLPGRTRDGSDQ